MASNLDKTLANILSLRLSQGRLRRLTIPSANSVDFSSNSYLSLSSNPAVKAAYLSFVQPYLQSADSEAGFGLGSGGSRLLDGNSAFTEDLEDRIAKFHGADAGLLFNSGFEANTGLFACVPQKGDVIVYDELIHASVHDGMRLSRAQRIPFAHNQVYESSTAASETSDEKNKRQCLDSLLRSLTEGTEGADVRNGKKNIFIAVEGVYSMDGDAAPLKDIVECVEKRLPLGNGYIIVDEAHSTGIFGHQGRGLVCHLGLESRIWGRVHTFGKAMGCSGGEFRLLSSFFFINLLIECLHGDSYCAMFFGNEIISHQLRPQLHIYNCHGVPFSCKHTHNLRLSSSGTRRSFASASPITYTPYAQSPYWYY